MAEPRIRSTLKELRARAGFAQRELADRVGVSRQTLTSLEAGGTVPSTGLALQIARALGCRVEDIFTLTDEDSPVRALLLAPPAVSPPRGHPQAEGRRVAMASVDQRWVAHALGGEGAAGLGTPADGLLLGRARGRGNAVRVKPLRQIESLQQNLFVAGCDPALGLLAGHLGERFPGARLHWIEAGSARALEHLAGGEVHLAGLHLFDEASGQFNVGAVRRRFGTRSMMLVNLAVWEQGLVVRRGNPRRVRGVSDLARKGVRFVGREGGSGASELLERLLARDRVPARALDTVAVAAGHRAVAGIVAAGAADAGVATVAAAVSHGLDFVPLAQTRFDLVFPGDAAADARFVRLLDVLASGRFRRDMGSLAGYVTTRTGELIAKVAA